MVSSDQDHIQSHLPKGKNFFFNYEWSIMGWAFAAACVWEFRACLRDLSQAGLFVSFVVKNYKSTYELNTYSTTSKPLTNRSPASSTKVKTCLPGLGNKAIS